MRVPNAECLLEVTTSLRSERPNHGPRYGFAAPTVLHARIRLPRWQGRKRIVQLTDLHFGNATPLALQREAVHLANEANPDLVVLTGDFVGLGRRRLDRLVEVLSELKTPSLSVLGNHDHWVGASEVALALERAGVALLENAWTSQGHGEDRLAVVGIDDQTTGHDDIDRATHGLLNTPAIALSHNPEAGPALWAKGVQLVLSGHTHGGQFWVRKWTDRLYNEVLRVRYVSGWYEEDGHRLFVNPGVGSSVVPWRYGRPAQRAVAILDVEGGPLAPIEIIDGVMSGTGDGERLPTGAAEHASSVGSPGG